MALGTWSNPYGALGGGKPSTGDLTMFGGPPASTSGGGFFSKLGGSDMWGALGGAVIGGFFQNRAANKAAQAQLNAAKAADWRAEQTILANRDTAKFGEGSKLQNQQWNEIASDFGLRRQQAAEMFNIGTLDPMRAAASRDAKRAEIGLQGSKEARDLRQELNREKLKNEAALRSNLMDKTFGYVPPGDWARGFGGN